jgi:DNA (cytosine-5)-methyltransferase 1
MPEKLREVKELYEFKQEFSPLRAFDPFAGVGAFVRGVENAGAIKFTHAIEICPSTAMTLRYVLSLYLATLTYRPDRKNNPGVAVFNQCANAMFDYAISREAGIDTDLRGLGDKPRRLRDPPIPDDIDCIVTGFPW